MKTPLLSLCWLFALPVFCLAGGFTSKVEIEKVTEIKIEKNKITIKGDGIVKRRVISTAEKRDETVFGLPAQWLHAKAEDTVFEVVPYFTPDIEGVSTGGHSEEELKELSAKAWVKTLATAKEIKVGEKLAINYQGDRITINGYWITKVVGYGSIRR